MIKRPNDFDTEFAYDMSCEDCCHYSESRRCRRKKLNGEKAEPEKKTGDAGLSDNG